MPYSKVMLVSWPFALTEACRVAPSIKTASAVRVATIGGGVYFSTVRILPAESKV